MPDPDRPPRSDDRPLRSDARRNRARVIKAAEAVLARDGMSASLREIARQAGVGLATIYRQFPTKEALYEAIVHARVAALAEEGEALLAAAGAGTTDPGEAFFAFFTLIVENATHKKMLVDALTDSGVDVKAGMERLKGRMTGAIEALLIAAQRSGAVRADVGIPEVFALLTAASMAAERGQWDEAMRGRALAVMFDGFRPRP
ncbi:TetR/AcrR family transcriptional regulator [Spirillospora sp. CA-255316]